MSSGVPDGWGLGFLSEFSEINPSFDKTLGLSDEIDVSFIKMEDVSNGAIVTNMRVRKYYEVKKGFTRFQNNDVLVAKITPCFENGKGGHVKNLINGAGFGSTEFHVFRAKDNSDSAYFHQFANYPAFRLKAEASMCGTGGQRRVQTDFYRTYKAAFPPLPEQKKIAAILSSVDDVIEKTQAQIDKLKDLKTGMMQELLTKGISHTEFKDSAVGRIPVGWDVKQLIECCEIMTNGYVGATRDIYQEDGIPYVLCQNVRPNSFTEVTHKYVSKEFHQKNIRACLKKGDVLTVQTGAGNGDTCVVPKSYEGANCHALIISRPIKSALNSYFFAEYMNSDFGKNRVNIIATGGAHPHLNTTDLRCEYIPLPPIEEQEMIAKTLASVQSKFVLLENRKEQIKNTKKALMQDLLTGKVRVKVDK